MHQPFQQPGPGPAYTRHPVPPAPLRDYLSAVERPGTSVDAEYVVLPRALLEQMEASWQQHAVTLLRHFHQRHGNARWPTYRVTPRVVTSLDKMNEEQLREAKVIHELDAVGEEIYWTRSGDRIDNPSEHTAMITCQDPLITRPTPPPSPQTAPARMTPPGGAPPPVSHRLRVNPS